MLKLLVIVLGGGGLVAMVVSFIDFYGPAVSAAKGTLREGCEMPAAGSSTTLICVSSQTCADDEFAGMS